MGPVDEREIEKAAIYDRTERASIAKREVPIAEESIQANEKLLYEQGSLITELFERLSPVINERRGEGTATPDSSDTSGAFSPMVNAIMNQNDMISANNRRIRVLMGLLEV